MGVARAAEAMGSPEREVNSPPRYGLPQAVSDSPLEIPSAQVHPGMRIIVSY